MRKRKARRQCKSCQRPVVALKNFFCNNSCQMEFQYKEYIKRWLAGKESGIRGTGAGMGVSSHIHRYLREKHGENCTRCGWKERHPITNKVPVNVDHIDGNPYNCQESNLTLLCPNCHSLTPTFGMLNSGNGRRLKGAIVQLGGRQNGILETGVQIPVAPLV